MNELNISNIGDGDLLKELEKRIDKGRIKVQGRYLLAQDEKGNCHFELIMDAEQALLMVKNCLVILEEEAYGLRNEVRDLKKEKLERKN